MIPFVEFVNNRFQPKEHLFMLRPEAGHAMPKVNNVVDLSQYPRWLRYGPQVFLEMYRAEKVIVHGLFDPRLIILLAFQPWLIRKTCWVIWGGDLYAYRNKNQNWKTKFREIFASRVIKNIPLITTTVPGDYELAKKWYRTKAKYIQNLMYPSHVIRATNPDKNTIKEQIFIQIGNSADPENNHKEIIDRLANLKNNNIIIFAPLSYGDKQYGDNISRYGKSIFGDKFIALRKLLSFEKYNEYLLNIDIVIFNHKRQQAMGNTIALLGFGKKVYLRSDVTPWPFFKNIGLSIFDSKGDISIEPLSSQEKNINRSICCKVFSESNLYESWVNVFSMVF